MNVDQARYLMTMTSDFYRRAAQSFSATRSAPWDGWEHVLRYCESDCGPDDTGKKQNLRVLDCACGNLRFCRFLAERTAASICELLAVDNCEPLLVQEPLLAQESRLAQEPLPVRTRTLDIGEALLHDGKLERELGEGSFDLAVCFAYMHHLPLAKQRQRLLQALLSLLKPDAHLIVSFWQFALDEQLAAKARATTARAVKELGIDWLEDNDYVLGWQEKPNLYRYCHHTSEEEIDALVATLSESAQEIERYSADGKSGRLNRYLVLRASP